MFLWKGRRLVDNRHIKGESFSKVPYSCSSGNPCVVARSASGSDLTLLLSRRPRLRLSRPSFLSEELERDRLVTSLPRRKRRSRSRGPFSHGSSGPTKLGSCRVMYVMLGERERVRHNKHAVCWTPAAVLSSQIGKCFRNGAEMNQHPLTTQRYSVVLKCL